MKFLHVADLHLGRRMGDMPLFEDQKYVLNQIIDMAKKEEVTAVLVAGDVYQKASPQSEAMTLFNDFVTELTDAGILVFAISGNHDSDQRISYFSKLVKKSGVYVTEKFEGTLQQITLEDEHGEVVISMIPFVRPINVKRCFQDETIADYADAFHAILDHSSIDKNKRNLLIAHQFITGAELSDSEERTVGGLDNIDGSLFDDFDYVALGHIHKAQKVGRDTLRYAGAPLKYSLSEANYKKSVTLVDMKEKGNVSVTLLPLKSLHDVRIIEGTLEEVLGMEYSEDFVQVTLHDELVPPDARVSISTVFPNMIKYMVVNSTTKMDIDILAKESIENKSVVDLFVDFFKLQNNDMEPTKEQMAVLEEALKGLEDDRYEAD